jgi:hypothetical protein
MAVGASILPENTGRTGRGRFNGFSNIIDRSRPQVDGRYREIYAG